MPTPLDPNAFDFARSVSLDEPILSVEYVAKGFSFDQKFRIQTSTQRFLLRVSASGNLDARRSEFEVIQALHRQGLCVGEPIRFEAGSEFCCALHRWVEGESGEDAIPRLSTEDQSNAGQESGLQLRLIHQAFPSSETINEAAVRGGKFRKVDVQCREMGLQFEGQGEAREFVELHLHLLESRPVTFRHGDFHPANLIFQVASLVGVIDFNRCDFGDPYDDFYKLAYFAAPISQAFASGVILGYFAGRVPDEFWPIYNTYVAAVLPADLVWCHTLYPEDLPHAMTRNKHILATHDFREGGPPSWWTKQDQV